MNKEWIVCGAWECEEAYINSYEKQLSELTDTSKEVMSEPGFMTQHVYLRVEQRKSAERRNK